MRPEGNTTTPIRVVVSGGIGSGKSTVIRILQDLGVVVIEADRIGHLVLEPDGAAHAAVAERWPSVVKDGFIDRSLLALIVFTDAEELAALEALTHPHIRAEIDRRVGDESDRDIAVELPLTSELMGSGWIRLVVDAPNQLRLRRTVARGMAEDDAANRLAIQPARTEWIESADVVVDNTGDVADLETEVRRIWNRLHVGLDS